MTIDLERFEKLKSEVERLKREKDRSEGVLDQLMQQLKDRFDCDSMEDAKQLEAKLKGQAARAERRFKSALREFEERWGETLNSE